MDAIWGKSFPFNKYSLIGETIFNNTVENCRIIIKNEFNSAIENKDNLHIGTRFRSNDQVLWTLQSNVTEKEFLKDPSVYIQRVLLGALSADHWYTYEKQWE